MNTRYFYRWLWSALVVLCLAVVFVANRAAASRVASQPQDAAAKASVETVGGLTVVTFVTNPGTIRVRLPNDMRAGDTISGTVIAEPRGETREEKTSNQSDLKKFGIRLFGRAEDKPEDVPIGDLIAVFKYALNNDRESGTVFSVGLQLLNGNTISKVTIPVLPLTPSGAVITPDPKITVPTTASGAVITPDPKITLPTTQSGAVITPDPKITPSFIIPPLGQAGRSLIIPGPFDGDSSNTTVSSNGFDVIAESPRQAIFKTPTDVTGSTDLRLSEGNTQTTGNYRNVGINLTSPKTNLVKGEKTTLTVQVNGLEGIKVPIPLTLDAKGVIRMEGGMFQPLIIQPGQIGADGRYTTTRGITGVQTGEWEATATVVTHPFDVCLQDDSSGNSLMMGSTTGDYIFWQSRGGSKAMVLPWIAQSRGSLAQPSDPKLNNPSVTSKPCVIVLEHNVLDRRVHVQIDTCAHTGSASAQATSPKVRFTITDRNIADNTCATR